MLIPNEAASIMAHGSVTPYINQQQYGTDAEALFHKQRADGDFDFISEIINIFNAGGFSPQAIDAFRNNKIVIDASVMVPEAQRHLMNRYFRSQMLSVRTADSINARGCLIDGGEYKDWIALFKDHIVPFLLQNSLPTKLF